MLHAGPELGRRQHSLAVGKYTAFLRVPERLHGAQRAAGAITLSRRERRALSEDHIEEVWCGPLLYRLQYASLSRRVDPSR